MSSNTIDFDLLFDADEYCRSGKCPWTFFAYPTSLAVEHGLPPDKDVCQLLGEIQSRGIDVAIWVDAVADNTTYFACKGEDRQRLRRVLADLERRGLFGQEFLSERCDALFESLE